MITGTIRATIAVTDPVGLPSGAIHVVQRRDPSDFTVVAMFTNTEGRRASQTEPRSHTNFFKALEDATTRAGWYR